MRSEARWQSNFFDWSYSEQVEKIAFELAEWELEHGKL